MSRLIGQSVPRLDAISKATGQCCYTADMKLPGMLHGRILRSSLPHARILRLNTARAAKLPGVKAVITAKDTAGTKYGFAYDCRDKLPLAMEGGVTLNPSFLDYKVPTVLEMPRVEVFFTEAADPVGPYGAKEAGEGTVGPTAPAIVNAIGEVVGQRPRSLPVTPEDLLRLLERAKEQGAL